jgi:tetratricopeptide (TPR) repeat protein
MMDAPLQMRGARDARLLFAVLLATLAAGSCSPAPKPALEPALPPDSIPIEADVRELVEGQIAVVRRDPSSAAAHGKLGLMYEANDLWVPAEASFANAAVLDPGQPLWRYHRSVVLREAGRTGEADQLLRQSGAELQNDPAVQHRLGAALLELGDVPGAEAAFQRALTVLPDQPECLVGMAFVRLAREDYAGARDLCLRAVKREPGFRQGQYALGLAYRGLGDTTRAETALTVGAEAKIRFLDDPFSPELKTYRVNLMSQITEATTLEQAHRPEEALAVWARIVERHPKEKNLVTNYGAALLGVGRTEEAIVQLKRSLELDDGEFATHLNLAEAYLKAGRWKEAAAPADRAVELGPQVGRTHRTRAAVLAAAGKYDEAYQELRRAIELDAHDAVAFKALTEMSLLSGREDEAKGWCETAHQLDPTNLPVRVNLARLTLRSGDTESARVQVKELLKIAPENPRVQALAAEVGLPR